MATHHITKPIPTLLEAAENALTELKNIHTIHGECQFPSECPAAIAISELELAIGETKITKHPDAIRLNWMESMRDYRIWFISAPGTDATQTLREAIDAAMSFDGPSRDDALPKECEHGVSYRYWCDKCDRPC